MTRILDVTTRAIGHTSEHGHTCPLAIFHDAATPERVNSLIATGTALMDRMVGLALADHEAHSFGWSNCDQGDCPKVRELVNRWCYLLTVEP